jgi:2-isopropylmalate synthase
MNTSDLIYDWNLGSGGREPRRPRRVDLNDETLRDGLQCPSATNPSIDQKKKLLELMVAIGVDSADIGLPAAGPRSMNDVVQLAEFIRDARLEIQPNCAGRTVRSDIEPIIEASQKTGQRLEAALFIGSSPIRQYAEDWTLERMLRATEEAVSFAVRHDVPVMYVTEDTTRARPETLKALYSSAIRAGAYRLCIADTVGYATPAGVRAILKFVRDEVVGRVEPRVKLDWHGHRDRGLAVANALAAAEAGADRIHATALGIGERCGNAEMELLLVNLQLEGARADDLSRLTEYVSVASDACGIPIARNWPVVGHDAFRTGTGVHAAAIIKAERKGDSWLADRVYSAVPAGLVGRSQRIDVSPMSGVSNVRYWLQKHGYSAADDGLASYIFAAAKLRNRTFEDREIHALCEEYLASRGGALA